MRFHILPREQVEHAFLAHVPMRLSMRRHAYTSPVGSTVMCAMPQWQPS